MPSLAPFAHWWTDLKVALIFLTRLPLRHRADITPADLTRATGVYPLAGLLVGLVGGGAYWLAGALGLSTHIAGFLAVGSTMLFTGALHEDGLADLADGLGGGGDRERKLEIMRDSSIGTYGVAALVLSIGLRAVALGALAGPAAATGALVAAHAVSRACLPLVMTALPLARNSGLAADTGRPTPGQTGTALILAIVIALVAQDFAGGAAGAAAAALGAAIVAALAQYQIGGYTGDVLGAVQQGAEVAVLLAAVALA